MEQIISNIKESGNFYFKNNNYSESDRKYRKVLRYIVWMDIKHMYNKERNKKMIDIEIQALLNLAAVKLKKKQYRDVINLCNHVSFP